MIASYARWLVTLTLGLCIVIISAGAGEPYFQMMAVALVAGAIALMAIFEHRHHVASGAAEAVISASTAKHMGLLWTWAALALFSTYFFILKWKEWMIFTIAALVIAGLCLFFAALLSRDATQGREDPALLSLGRYLTIAQLVGMIAAAIGLVIDNKFPPVIRAAPWEYWAANNIFFFGALALGAISLNALLVKK